MKEKDWLKLAEMSYMIYMILCVVNFGVAIIDIRFLLLGIVFMFATLVIGQTMISYKMEKNIKNNENFWKLKHKGGKEL